MSEHDPFFEPEPEEPFKVPENFAQKGDFFDIRKKIPDLNNLMIGLGWDHKIFEESPVDVDLSCFLLDRTDQTRENEDFIFYNSETGCMGAVRHQGDSRTGAGDGDDETILIDLNGIPFEVLKIVFVVSIYEAYEREQNFGMVRNLYFRMVNEADGNEIFRFKLPEIDYAESHAIRVGELVREGPRWFFNAEGTDIPGGLAKIATQYGMVIQL